MPNVTGETGDDVAYGAGWAVAESRLLVAELGRILGRAGAIEMGGGGSDLVASLKRLGQVQQINYTDAELEQNLTESIAAAGERGPAMLSAIDAFVAGMNAWIAKNTWPKQLQDLGLSWRPWTRDDVLAVGIIVDDIFGSGGGDEVGNAAALQALTTQKGSAAGTAIYDALRMVENPEATNQVSGRYPYPLYANADGTEVSAADVVDPRSVAMPDADGSVAPPAPATPTMSNALALDGSRTKSGHPILVGGPQSSYFAPELLFEMELHGGGYDARGITFPGLGPWVVIGRSRSYAWTATAGGSDLSDERVEQLCEPDGSPPTETSTHYVFDGACRAMTRPDTAATTAWRTVHGPVVSRAHVKGQPVAVTRERGSRFQTARATTAFWALNHGEVTTASDFAPTMSSVPMSFNWIYVNASDIAYFHSGYYPIRARGASYDLPTWGTGEWEWRGRLDMAQHPQEIDPPSGLLVSWNNKVAPGWATSDNDWGVGATERVDLIRERALSLHDATPADVVAAVQDAGTVDLRGEMVMPRVLEVLDAMPAPTPELDKLRTELARWSASGAHRRDRDGDGFYDDPMVPIMESLFGVLLKVTFEPSLGAFFDDPAIRHPKILDMAGAVTGSTYGHGWYSILDRDLRTVLAGGAGAFCGGGQLKQCASLMWEALGSAAFSAGPWLRWTALDRIRFIPFVTDLESMRWVNRPTFQEVMSFGS